MNWLLKFCRSLHLKKGEKIPQSQLYTEEFRVEETKEKTVQDIPEVVSEVHT